MDNNQINQPLKRKRRCTLTPEQREERKRERYKVQYVKYGHLQRKSYLCDICNCNFNGKHGARHRRTQKHIKAYEKVNSSGQIQQILL